MESEFPSNSNTRKPPKAGVNPAKKVEKVVTGEVIQRKKPLGKRFRETFSGDDNRSVGSYVLFDVLIPAAKDMIADAVSQGIERKLFGEVRSSSRRGGYRPGGSIFGNASYNPYHRYSGGGGSSLRPDPRQQSNARSRNRVTQSTYDEIILATRAEATEVIDNLIAIIAQYDVATVADLFELVGVTGEFTDEKWGWTDLMGADIQRIHEGYLLNLPRPQALN